MRGELGSVVVLGILNKSGKTVEIVACRRCNNRFVDSVPFKHGVYGTALLLFVES
jgi:hypothetical protein